MEQPNIWKDNKGLEEEEGEGGGEEGQEEGEDEKRGGGGKEEGGGGEEEEKEKEGGGEEEEEKEKEGGEEEEEPAAACSLEDTQQRFGVTCCLNLCSIGARNVPWNISLHLWSSLAESNLQYQFCLLFKTFIL